MHMGDMSPRCVYNQVPVRRSPAVIVEFVSRGRSSFPSEVIDDSFRSRIDF
jgi:hypothetical protein